eukprot:NODE_6341_length_514_cov_229.653595.p2 GENE.NODE_6341_length_514_cov_229.653595~~NODE_6341_length_514_cov_229.653595.p2  ORF type:complete len:80 (-),score=1.98 NODE_6341_length_514_cov_229.653595:29-268(-)
MGGGSLRRGVVRPIVASDDSVVEGDGGATGDEILRDKSRTRSTNGSIMSPRFAAGDSIGEGTGGVTGDDDVGLTGELRL